MTHHCNNIACALLLVLLLCRLVRADFEGFPLAGSTNVGSWQEAIDTYDPFGQIYSGVVERCTITGVGEPSVVETWTVYWGTNSSIVTNDGYVYTNYAVVTTNVTTTNQTGPFTYAGQEGTMTGLPQVTHAFVAAMDTAIEALMPYFAATNQADAGVFNSYFQRTDAATNRPTSFPMWSFAALSDGLGIGFSTNLTTNAWDHVTGGDAYWTSQPEYKANWVLADAHWTGSWNFTEIDDLDTRLYNSEIRPVILYAAGGTNALGSLSVTLSGSNLVWADQSLVNTTETVSVTSSNTALDERWYRITNIVVGSAAPNTNDALSIVWTNRLVLYGDIPYRLHAEDIDERVVALEAMLWTTSTTAWGSTYDYSAELSFRTSSWAAAQLWVSNNWAQGITPAGGVHMWTRGVQNNASEYKAEGDSQSNTLSTSGINTNYGHSIDFYLETDDPFPTTTNSTFNSNGFILVEESLTLFGSVAETYSAGVTSPIVGATNVAVWPDEPPALPQVNPSITDGPSTGFKSGIHRALIKWDGANGFEYK